MDEKLSLAIAEIDLQLILQEVRELKANLSLELQAARDDRRAQQREFEEFMAHLRETLDQVRARHHMEAQLLDLVRPNAGKSMRQGTPQKNRNRDGRITVNYTKPGQTDG